jgi:asparagine synthase (glutamine-hydrolysing)
VWAEGWLANRRSLLETLALPGDAALETVVGAAYRRWGRVFPDRFEGTVAAILWEAGAGTLLLVADRLGHATPAWMHGSSGLRVAADPDHLLEPRTEPLELDELSVVCFLGGDVPPPGRTFFRGVRTVPAGCWVALSPQREVACRYWRPEPKPVLKLASDAAYAERLTEVLGEVIADYAPPRAGVTMTSGLDSNSVAAVLRAVAPATELRAFGWSAPELPESDELPLARRVADRLGVPLREIRVDACWPLRGAANGLTPRSEPFRNYYEEAWEATFRAVRADGLDVLITGAGGDSLVGGVVYSYPDLLLRGRWRELAGQLRRHLPRSSFTPPELLRRMILRPILQAYSPTWQERLARPVPWLAERHRDLYRRTVAAHDPPRAVLPGRYLRLRSLRDRATRRILPHLARHAARHGVRLLHPLLDRRLIDFAAGLPTEQSFAEGVWKVALRRAMRGRLPDEVVELRGKIAPTALLARGLRERETARVWELMTDMRAAELGFVDEPALRQHYREYLDGRHSGAMFWYTVTLEDWLRRIL